MRNRTLKSMKTLLKIKMSNICENMPSLREPSDGGMERQGGIHEGILDSRVRYDF